MKWITPLVLVVLATSMSAASIGQTTLNGQSPQSDSNQWQNDKRSLKGTVLSANGQPVSGATVEWLAVPWSAADMTKVPAKVLDSRKTGKDGKFEFKNAPALAKVGGARVVAKADGKLITILESRLMPGAEVILQPTTNSNVMLTVLDPSGKPAAKAKLDLKLMIAGNRISWIYPLTPVTTDAAGIVIVPGLPSPARLRVSVLGKPFDIGAGQSEVIVLRKPETKPQPLRTVKK
ncbi:MAG: carboxypeptidase-like regulatory domain-containing protein [Armatimonadota bacterium]